MSNNRRHLTGCLAAMLGVGFALGGLTLLAAQPPPPDAKVSQFVRAWGKMGAEPGEFHTPIGIAVNKADHTFVADLNNKRVQKFDTDGKFLGAIDVPGKPGGIALDAMGNVYVSLFDKDRIAVFTEAGKPLREWGKTSRGDSEFKFPDGLTIRPDGSVYLGDDVDREGVGTSPAPSSV